MNVSNDCCVIRVSYLSTAKKWHTVEIVSLAEDRAPAWNHRKYTFSAIHYYFVCVYKVFLHDFVE